MSYEQIRTDPDCFSLLRTDIKDMQYQFISVNGGTDPENQDIVIITADKTGFRIF